MVHVKEYPKIGGSLGTSQLGGDMILDNSTSYKVSKFYTGLTCVYLPILITLLFTTNAYLYAGRTSFYPVFLLLVFLEFMKSIYVQVMCIKDLSYNPKKRGFKLFSVILSILKQTKFVELARSVAVLVLCTFFMFVICIFYGAPFLDSHEETLMFSVLVVILTVFPMCLDSGANAVLQLVNGVVPNDTFNRILFRNIQLTLVGAWLGAFVIPLDWDREWQVWPISCSSGALCGHFVSNVISLIQVFSRFFDKSVSKSR